VSRLTPAQIAEELVTRGLWLSLTGTLYQDGSDCDAVFWADCEAEAKRAIANLRPVPEAEALGPTVRKVPL
jgi:hypothetical protein